MLAQIGSYFFSGTRELVLYALGFALLETLWPAAADQPRWRRDTHVDLLYSFLVPILAFPAYWLALAAIVQLLHRPEAAGPLHVLHGWVSSRSLWLQVPAALVIADLSGYWRHRLLHTRWLWPFHAIHHSSQQVDWLSNERVHPVESVLTSLEQLVTLMVLGFGPQIVAVNALARRTHSLFEHSNLRFSYGPLNYLLVSPRFHRWHHSDDGRLVDKNFANFFSVFDFAFGTFHLPPGESARSFGLPDHSMGRAFLGQLAYPFRRLAAEIKDARGRAGARSTAATEAG